MFLSSATGRVNAKDVIKLKQLGASNAVSTKLLSLQQRATLKARRQASAGEG